MNVNGNRSCSGMPNGYLQIDSRISISIGVVTIILSFMAVMINATMMASFYATKQMSAKRSNLLIICLSLTDMVGAAFGMAPFAGLLLKRSISTDCYMETTTVVMMLTCYTLELYLTTILTMDRYFHMNPNIVSPSRLMTLFEQPYLYFMLAAGVLLSVANGLLYVLLSRQNFKYGAVFIMATSVFAALTQLTVTVLYSKGYRRILRFTSNTPIYDNTTSARPQYLKSLYKSVLCLTVTSLATHVPITIVNAFFATCTLMHRCENHFAEISIALSGTYISVFATMVLNPVIILHFNKRARSWVFERLSKLPPRQHRRTFILNQLSKS